MSFKYYADSINTEKTDFKRWRLVTNSLGATEWKYIKESEDLSKAPQQTGYVKYSLDTYTDAERQEIINKVNADIPANYSDAYKACLKAARFFQTLQDENSGIFPMMYKGPMFMTVGYVAVSYILKNPIPEAYRLELIRYLVNTAHPVDGGWGLHEYDKSTCFGTSINYVMLRLLGVSKDHPTCAKARTTLLTGLSSALGTPHWGKTWLSILNLYKWEGVNPAPPELWMLPYKYNPIHPGKWWVHTRAVYQPVGYLSSIKYQCELDDLLKDIRNEIYSVPYDLIDFSKNRNNVCPVDLYYPHTTVLNILNDCVVFYNKYLRTDWIAKKANQTVYEVIKKEIQNTEELCIAPVSFSFNALVVYLEEGKDSALLQRFMKNFDDILFMGPQGMCAMGTNGGQVWDISFVLQYFVVAGLADNPEFDEMIIRGYNFLLRSQFTEDCVEGSYRDKRKGAFPYSTKSQGYTVSDCTAEAIKAILMVYNHPRFTEKVTKYDEDLMKSGIDVLLSLQNVGSFHYGAFSTYEVIRATPLLELINPAEVFGNIMVEYPYVECTDSSVLGLTYFRKYYPDYKNEKISKAIDDAIAYIKSSQDVDGSWYGCWGICFTYAGMFALEALSTIGLSYENDEVVRKGCDFLVSRVNDDGGWSELMKSCETHTYVNTKKSMVVQTSWVLIGLILVKYPKIEIIERAATFLLSVQHANGEFRQDEVCGVFNHSCGIDYPNYVFSFSIKALGLYEKMKKSIETNQCL